MACKAMEFHARHGCSLPCDVFDALVSARPYKAPIPLEEAVSQMAEGSGPHFDPVITSAFQKIAHKLYREVVMADSSALHTQVRSALYRYFKIEAPDGYVNVTAMSIIKEDRLEHVQ